MRFFWNIVLLPLKIIALPFLLLGVLLKIIAGVSLGILGLLGGVFGVFFLILLLPGAFIGLTLGGGIVILTTIAIIVVIAKAIPAIGRTLVGGVSSFLGRWA